MFFQPLQNTEQRFKFTVRTWPHPVFMLHNSCIEFMLTSRSLLQQPHNCGPTHI